MNTSSPRLTGFLAAMLILSTVTFSPYGIAEKSKASIYSSGYNDGPVRYTSDPTAAEMVGDIILARPALLVATTLGTALFTVSLPFSILGGNLGDAFDKLVLDPARATFFRCLGCTDYNRSRTRRR